MTNSSGKSQKPSPNLLPRPVRPGQWNGKDLPIWKEKDKIISAVSKYPLVVLTAPPGIGKSTQLPIMMLEADYKKIILVVPEAFHRKCSAIGLLAKKIKNVYHYYHKVKDLLSEDTTKLLLDEADIMIKSDSRMESFNKFSFSSDNERLRYCILIGLVRSLCYHLPYHIDTFIANKVLNNFIENNVLINYKSSYFYDRQNEQKNFSLCSRGIFSSSSHIFSPDGRQCLLVYQDSVPRSIVSNVCLHLDYPTFSLYTEIDSQWIVATNINPNFETKILDLVFCCQGIFKWHKVRLKFIQNIVVDYAVESEGKNATPMEVLAQSIKYYGRAGKMERLRTRVSIVVLTGFIKVVQK